MADVKPFRALRYDERRAGPLDELVAPPYDVISAEAARALPDEKPVQRRPRDAPGRRGGRRAGARRVAGRRRPRARRPSPRSGGSRRTTPAPTASPGGATGWSRALRLEPYEAGVVLPHERTHAGPKEGRLRLLRATRTHVEPIFLLYEGALAAPSGEPAVDVELDGVRSRLWRVERRGAARARRRAAADRRRPPPLRDRARLPRGGRHRGERVDAGRDRPHRARTA